VIYVLGLEPSDPVERAICDSIFEHAQDLSRINPIVNIYRGDAFKEKKEEYFSTFETKVACLVKMLGKGPFFGERESPSYADFHVYHVLSMAKLVEPECLKDKKSLLDFLKTIENLPGVSAYLTSRPKPVDIGTKPVLDPKPPMHSPVHRRFTEPAK